MKPLAAAIALASAAAAPFAGAVDAPATQVRMHTADGQPAGVVVVEETPNGLLIRAQLENLPEGPHGFHIHETGACEPDFSAAGGHFAPDGGQHGHRNTSKSHAGDLPNIHVAADGTAMAEVFVERLALRDGGAGPERHALFDGDGAALIVHAQEDDYLAESSSGERIACGVIAPTGG